MTSTFDPNGLSARYIVLVDPATGLPYAASGGGGGGSTTTKATAAAPVFVEGSTTNQLSVDLAGNLRVIGATSSATGAAVPASASYEAANVGGTLRGLTAVNPSGVVYALQTDVTSVGGTTVATGNGIAGAGVQRVAIASDQTAFAVNATLAGTLPAYAATPTFNLGTTTNLTPGTGATNLGKAEDQASADGDVGVMALAVRQATPANTSGADGDYEALRVSNGLLFVQGAGTAGVSTGGVLSIQGVASGTAVPTSISGTVSVTPRGATSGGMSVGRRISTADTNAVSLKGSAGHLYGYHIANNGAAWAYFKLYGKATAPTVGTDTPVETIGIPPGGTATWSTDIGVVTALGLAYAITGGIADTDTTALAANQVTANIYYQ